MVDHVQEDHASDAGITEGDERSRSALCEAREQCRSLSNEPAEARTQIQAYENLVEELRQKLAVALDGNRDLQRVLDKERQKSKRFWKHKCDLMLAHEDTLDEKDAVIAALQEQVRTTCPVESEIKYSTPQPRVVTSHTTTPKTRQLETVFTRFAT